MKTNTTPEPRVEPYVIAPLNAEDRPRVVEHLLSLDEAGRSSRFGVATDPEIIARYVASIDFDSDRVLGAVAPDGALVGLAHIAVRGATAELGLSVSSAQRRRGVAGALTRAALRERDRVGAREFRFHYSSANIAMRRLAEQFGMRVSTEGS
jgi:RimJ/RimL family protein N-acetyltransferase